MKRVFFGVKISDAARAVTSAYMQDLRRSFPDVRASWVRKENLHITLKFLGKVDDDRIVLIKEAASIASSISQPFKIRIDKPGRFGEKVLYLSTIDESSRLSSLYKKLENELQSVGFEKEKRPFRSHLTIARIRSQKGIKPLLEKHLSGRIDQSEFQVAEFVLFESNLTSKGSEYSEIATFPLNVNQTT